MVFAGLFLNQVVCGCLFGFSVVLQVSHNAQWYVSIHNQWYQFFDNILCDELQPIKDTLAVILYCFFRFVVISVFKVKLLNCFNTLNK